MATEDPRPQAIRKGDEDIVGGGVGHDPRPLGDLCFELAGSPSSLPHEQPGPNRAGRRFGILRQLDLSRFHHEHHATGRGDRAAPEDDRRGRQDRSPVGKVLHRRLFGRTIEDHAGGAFLRVVGVHVHDGVKEVGVLDQRGGDQQSTGERHALILAYSAQDLLRIITANLYNGRADADALGEILDKTRPDVVAAQEMAPSAGAAIAARMPHGIVLPALDHTGAALAANQPIDVQRHSLPHRDALVGRLEHEGRPLVIWSVHLANPIDIPPLTRKRRAQVLALEEALGRDLGPDGRIMLVGDLNATPLWPAYRRLRRLLSDGVAEWAARTKTRPERTWSYRPGGRPLLRIDHALTAGMTVHNAETVVVPGSDHRALLVDVS